MNNNSTTIFDRCIKIYADRLYYKYSACFIDESRYEYLIDKLHDWKENDSILKAKQDNKGKIKIKR